MRYLKKLYMGKNASAHPEQSLDDLRSGRFVSELYALTAPMSENDQAEIIRTSYLRQPYYLKKDPLIIGLAVGRDEALELLVRLTDDALARLGRPDIRAFIRLLEEDDDGIS